MPNLDWQIPPGNVPEDHDPEENWTDDHYDGHKLGNSLIFLIWLIGLILITIYGRG
jgi:hypothetical protein